MRARAAAIPRHAWISALVGQAGGMQMGDSLLRQLPPGPLPPSWGCWAPYNGVEIPPSQALFLISLQPRSSLVRAVLFPHFTDGERETQVARGAQENTVLVTEAGFHPKQSLSPLRSAPALAPAGSREAASEACSVSEPRGAPPASPWRGVGAPGWRALWGRVWAFPLGCEGRGVCFGVIPADGRHPLWESSVHPVEPAWAKQAPGPRTLMSARGGCCGRSRLKRGCHVGRLVLF